MRKSSTYLLLAVLVLGIAASVWAKTPHRRTNIPVPTGENVVQGHTCTDLGLSVKWADCNLGARTPSAYGDFYCWGEIGAKEEFYDSTCATWNRNFDYEPICADTLYDAATVEWGDRWRLPSYEEMKELIDSCTWRWEKRDKVPGYRVTGPSGGSIFLPAAGFMIDVVNLDSEKAGYYWTGDPISTRLAAIALFDDSVHTMFNFTRSCGLPIRPVTSK